MGRMHEVGQWKAPRTARDALGRRQPVPGKGKVPKELISPPGHTQDAQQASRRLAGRLTMGQTSQRRWAGGRGKVQPRNDGAVHGAICIGV